MIKEAIKKLSPRNGWVLLEELYKKVEREFPPHSVLIELKTLEIIGTVELDLIKNKVRVI